MFSWLNDTALRVFGEAASWPELVGFVSGLACVYLVVRQRIANWPVGIASVIAFMAAFWAAGLYADAGLQVVYVVLGCYGWWQWHTGRDAVRALPVRLTSPAEWWWLGIGGAVAAGALWALLAVATDSKVPAADAVTTALSLVATYGQCRKLLESWWFWIAADLIYIPLYAYKQLYLTTVLYAVFLALSVAGRYAWSADRRGRLAAVPGLVETG